VDASGNDGNASMPEEVKRPNPWRKMMMVTQKSLMWLELEIGEIPDTVSKALVAI